MLERTAPSSSPVAVSRDETEAVKAGGRESPGVEVGRPKEGGSSRCDGRPTLLMMVSDLKELQGKDIWLLGGRALFRSLVDADLDGTVGT